MPPLSSEDSPTRRELLEMALGSSVVGFAGCLSGQESSDENTDGPSETVSPPSPESNRSATPSSTPLGSDGRHDFWISNRTGTEYAVELTVSRVGTDIAVLDGCYESLAGLAVRFRDVGAEEVTYDVTASVVGVGAVEDRWIPSACPEAYTGLFGTDGGVIIDDDLSFTQNECDYATVGHEVPETDPEDAESCPEPTPSPQSVTTISPSRTSTG